MIDHCLQIGQNLGRNMSACSRHTAVVWARLQLLVYLRILLYYSPVFALDRKFSWGLLHALSMSSKPL